MRRRCPATVERRQQAPLGRSLGLLIATALAGAAVLPGRALSAELGAPGPRVPSTTALPTASFSTTSLTTAPVPSRPATVGQRELVLDRRRRHLLVLEGGRELRRFPVAVGRPGWETPVGRFQVIELVANPVWEHPATGQRVQPGPANPLGSRWIGFHRDCQGRRGFNGRENLVVEGCVSAGFHGTPNRETVGQAASHGCVRLFDEHVRELFALVQMGTPVTVLP
ncbi:MULTISPECIES: L,D-transpeptidase [Aphanothece]|uniref:L,D-transpeptidase n=1 Tax=Aphanothece TaxID=1121 RepID=UPI003984E4C0